jgi:hypothetical protein
MASDSWLEKDNVAVCVPRCRDNPSAKIRFFKLNNETVTHTVGGTPFPTVVVGHRHLSLVISTLFRQSLRGGVASVSQVS